MTNQLDFISGYAHICIDPEDIQSEFWDSSYNKIKHPKSAPSYKSVIEFFTDIDPVKIAEYEEYWETIAPKNDSDFFKRWLFAFMSVHTSWKANIAGYNAIKSWWLWLNRPEKLLEDIKNSAVGMHNLRVKFISEFAHKFWENPSNYRKTSVESWSEFRDRLQNGTLGLGAAKTSFALEMCYPNSAEVVCLDTHMFQAYGLDQTKDAKQYRELENHWVDMCSMRNVSPYIARCIYWDKKQNKDSSKYWSHVLEN